MWRIIVIAVLVGLILYLLRGGSREGRPGPEDLVRDALTGVYFSKNEGVSITRGGETLYFSSVENRDRFLAERR